MLYQASPICYMPVYRTTRNKKNNNEETDIDKFKNFSKILQNQMALFLNQRLTTKIRRKLAHNMIMLNLWNNNKRD